MVGKKFQIGNGVKGLFLSVYVDDIKMAGKKQNINSMWKVQDIVDHYRNMFESKISAGGTDKTCVYSGS